MGNTVKEFKKYRQDCEITETYVDGDLYKITEEYKDDQGEVVYVYEYYPTPGEMLKAQKQKETTKNKKKNESKINKKLAKNKKKHF